MKNILKSILTNILIAITSELAVRVILAILVFAAPAYLPISAEFVALLTKW